jgi:hypothetical protein
MPHPDIPDFVDVAGRSYEVVLVRRVVWLGVEYDCRASHALRRFYVSAAAPHAVQRRALDQAVSETRQLLSHCWQPAA